jgi:hypothetical protein
VATATPHPMLDASITLMISRRIVRRRGAKHARGPVPRPSGIPRGIVSEKARNVEASPRRHRRQSWHRRRDFHRKLRT